MAKSPDGNIWVGTYGGGLDMIEKNPKGNEKKKFQFIHYKNDENKNSISSNQIFSICFDNAGIAWIGTANGLNAFNVSAKTFTHLFHVQDNANSITSNMVRKVYKDDNGKIWICGSGMLDNISQKKNDQSNFFIHHFLPIVATNKNFSHVVVNDLIKDRNDNYWIGTNDNGLIKFRIADKQLSSVEQYTSDERSSYSLTNSTVFNLYEDHSGIIWIGTAKGVSKYLPSKKRFAEVAMNYPLTRNEHSVNTLLTDKFGRLWLGGDSDTLNISNKPSSPFSTKQFPVLPGNDNQVNILYQSKRSDIYIGTFRQGVFVIPNSVDNRLDKKNWLHININANPKLPSNNIYALTEDNEGRILIGTYKGVCRYDPISGRTDSIYASPQELVISDYIIRSLYVDNNNITWCGTDNGLRLIKNGVVIKTFKNNEQDTTSLTNNRITVVFADQNKNIWVGTKAGLNLFNQKENNFHHFPEQNESIQQAIMSIQEDKHGNLWVGTNQGLTKFNINKKKFYHYTIQDGLCSDEFMLNASCKDSSGIFYFSTVNGIVSFIPDSIKPNAYIPPVTITSIKIFDNSIFSLSDTALINTYKREKKLVLDYNQNFFSFQFAALNYINSAANRYAYKLEGIDKQWNQSGTQHFAGYTDIDPGHYVFKVKASNNDGVWNDVPATVEVIILPPWWRTWWFYSLCFITACSIIYLIYRMRLKQILKLYRLRSSIAKDLHDDVGSALSSIALLTQIAKQEKTKASLKPEEIFSRIGDTSKRMIDLMDDIVWAVNPDNDRFSNMLVRMREYAVEMLETKDISFTLKTSEEIDDLKIPMQMRKDYFLIFKEAVNNLAKYAECNHASINIQRSNHSLITSIVDDGRGFDPSIIHSGNGLKNMLERANSIKGKLTIETEKDKGTTITLIIPVT